MFCLLSLKNTSINQWVEKIFIGLFKSKFCIGSHYSVPSTFLKGFQKKSFTSIA